MALLDPILSLEGRVGRQHYAAYWVLSFIPYGLVAAVVAAATMDVSGDEPKGPSLSTLSLGQPHTLIFGAVGVPLLLVCLCVSMSFNVRRFHDMGLSGNWNWLVLVLPFVQIPKLETPDPLPALPFLIWGLVLIFVPGTRGDNSYGPAPRTTRRRPEARADVDVQ